MQDAGVGGAVARRAGCCRDGAGGGGRQRNDRRGRSAVVVRGALGQRHAGVALTGASGTKNVLSAI